MKPVVLLILDGFGHRTQKTDNAIANAKTPTLARLTKEFGCGLLKASGDAVGMPNGYIGNSEVGHIALGSGRSQPQAMEIVNAAISNKKFFKNKALVNTILNAQKKGTAVHLMGLISKNGVHAHENHLFALLKLCRLLGQRKIWIHFFSDGRDSKPKTALQYLNRLNQEIKKNGDAKIGTVIGRFFAMDRDNRWNRTQQAFECMVDAKGKKSGSARQAILNAYGKKLTDEFIEPTIIGDYNGMHANDSVLFFNFRLDRARQLSHAFLDSQFTHFKRKKPKIRFAAFFPYYKKIPCAIAFSEPKIKNGLGETLSQNGLSQLRIAETEKFAHMTYFFNGENEKPFANEKRILIQSPKVKTYDRTPEMKCPQITKQVLKALDQKTAEVIIANFANADMLGHTGNFSSTIQAIEVMDRQIKKIVSAVLAQNGVLMITADHGNCEYMPKVNGGRKKSHTTNSVPIWMVHRPKVSFKKTGELSDVAPTVLDFLKIKKPREMTGKSLLNKIDSKK